jgi:single-strand DNA-binding protein
MYKNHIDLIGFVGSVPETRTTQNGTAMTTFSLATKASWKNDAGSYEHRVDWHRVVCRAKQADWAAKLAKGAHLEVEGELRYRTYQKEVKARTRAVAVDMLVAEIHASVIRKLDRPAAASGESELPEGAPE